MNPHSLQEMIRLQDEKIAAQALAADQMMYTKVCLLSFITIVCVVGMTALLIDIYKDYLASKES
jgi:hypothetical protein